MFFFCLFEQSHLIYGGSWHRCQFLKNDFPMSSDEHLHSGIKWKLETFHFAWPAMDSCGNTLLDVGVPVHRWLMPIGSDLTLWKQCDDLGVLSENEWGQSGYRNGQPKSHWAQQQMPSRFLWPTTIYRTIAAFRLFLRNHCLTFQRKVMHSRSFSLS